MENKNLDPPRPTRSLALSTLLAGREFVGEEWFRWLQQHCLPFQQRLKRNALVPNSWNRM